MQYGGRCSATHCGDARLLIASHVKPWYLSDNAERLDPHNGLLLTPNLDKVFYAGFITFDPANRGRLVFSNTLREPEALGLSDTMFVPFSDQRLAAHLREHKRRIFGTERCDEALMAQWNAGTPPAHLQSATTVR